MSDIVKDIQNEKAELILRLSEYLIDNGRLDDWRKAIKNKDYLNELLAEMMEHESISI